MDNIIITRDWSYTKATTIKDGWAVFWWTLTNHYPRLFVDYKDSVNYAGKPMGNVYQHDFWLLLSGYEADF